MTVQSTYSDTQPAAVAGMPATLINGPVISRTVETANVPFGRAVTQGVADKGCILFGSGHTVFLGIALMDRSAAGTTVVAGQITARTPDTFGVGESALIAPVGSGRDVWVVCATGCSAGDSVFVRPSNGALQDSNANSAVQIPGARWDTSAAAAGLAVVRLA